MIGLVVACHSPSARSPAAMRTRGPGPLPFRWVARLVRAPGAGVGRRVGVRPRQRDGRRGDRDGRLLVLGVRAEEARAVDDLVALALPQVHLELAFALPDHVLVGHVLDPPHRRVREHRVAHAVVHPGEVAEGLGLLVVVAVAVAILVVVVVAVVHVGFDERAEVHAAEHDAPELRVVAPVQHLVNGDVGDLGTPLADHGVDARRLWRSGALATTILRWNPPSTT